MEDNNTYSNEKLLIKIQEEPLSGSMLNCLL